MARVSNVTVKATSPTNFHWARDQSVLYVAQPGQVAVKFTDKPTYYRHTCNETEEDASHTWYFRTAPSASVIVPWQPPADTTSLQIDDVTDAVSAQ